MDQQVNDGNALASALGIVMGAFAKALELILNSGNKALLDEFEACAVNALGQARRAMSEGRRPLN
jgi:hypothetical protein